MNIALIGASGFVGKAILNELVAKGHHVTAIVRDITRLTVSEKIKPVKADAFNEDEIAKAVKGSEVVVSAYNAGWTNPDLYGEFIRGAKAIQAGVKKAKVKRLIVIGGAGSLFIAPGLQVVDTEGFPPEWKPGALAARDYLNILREETELDWTFVSPALEMHQGTSGIRTGVYRSGLDNPVFDANGRSIISVEDIAVAVADEVADPKHVRQRFIVAY